MKLFNFVDAGERLEITNCNFWSYSFSSIPTLIWRPNNVWMHKVLNFEEAHMMIFILKWRWWWFCFEGWRWWCVVLLMFLSISFFSLSFILQKIWIDSLHHMPILFFHFLFNFLFFIFINSCFYMHALLFIFKFLFTHVACQVV